MLKVIRTSKRRLVAALIAPLILIAGAVLAQCPPEPPLLNYDGAGSTVCPCFVPGEHAGVVLDAPPSHYPLEILRIGIGWGSLFNGNPAQIEQALHIYSAGLPNPGAPQFSLPGPQFNDGFINEFNIEFVVGNKDITSGPFAISVEFLNQSNQSQFASSVVHDGNGCQAGKNMVYASATWFDACLLGVTGDWVMYVVYRPCVTATGIDGTFISASSPAFIARSHPNPFTANTEVEFILQNPGPALVAVYDVRGRRVATLADGDHDAGIHTVGWDGIDANGAALPSGMYFVRLEAAGISSVRKIVLAK